MAKVGSNTKSEATPAQLLVSSNLRLLMSTHPTVNTVATLSQESGVDSTTINRILRCANAPSVVILEVLAKALGVPLWRLHVPEDASEVAAWTIKALVASPPSVPAAKSIIEASSKKPRRCAAVSHPKQAAA